MPHYLTVFSRGFDPGEILGADPVGLVTQAIPIAHDQGWLPRGSFIDWPGRDPATPATKATNVGNNTFGVLAHGVDTEQETDTAGTVYLSGTFILPRIRQVNPEVNFNGATLEALRAKRIILENANY
jgi:hypothetical protein